MKKLFNIFILSFFLLFSVNVSVVNADILFQDAFTAPDGTSLSSYNPAYSDPCGTATIQNGTAVAICSVLVPSIVVADVCVSADMKFTGGEDGIAINSRANTDFTEHYEVAIYGDGTYVLNGLYNGSNHILSTGPGMPISEFHNYKLCTQGTNISFYLDNELIADTTDSGISSGTVGFYGGSKPLDNFLVTTISPTSKDQCKNGGWMNFTNPTFNNQGECIQYFNSL
jgi:hypothetical protein